MKGKGEDMNMIFYQLTYLYIYFFQETACPFFKKKMGRGRRRWKQGMSHTDSLGSVCCRESVAKWLWSVKEEEVS